MGKLGERVNTAVWIEKYQRWQINVQKDGIRKSFYSSRPGRTGQREANAKADKWLEFGTNNEAKRVEQMYLEYLDDTLQTTSKTNYMKLESLGRVWILPNIGHLKVGKVTEMHLQKIINAACAKGLSKKSVINIRAAITSFIKYCRKAKATTLIPEDLTISHSVRYKGKKILQPAELKILFSVDTTLYKGKRVPDKLINAYRFHVLTGMRPGELLGLKWKDIKKNTVRITESKNWLNEFTDGKNQNAIRQFSLNERTKAIIDDQRTKTVDSEFVFGELTQNQYYNSFKRYCIANNITPISPYELRHTFISIAKRLPEGDVKALVGHSLDMDTFGTYGHEMDGDSERVSNLLNDVFSNILE